MGEVSFEKYYVLTDTLLNEAHQPGMAPRNKSELSSERC